MPKPILTAIAIALICYGAVQFWNSPAPGPEPQPTPNVTVVLPDVAAPSAVLQALVAPTKTLLASNKSTATELAWFYYDFANVVAKDADRITSTTQFAKFNTDALTLGLSGSIVPVPGLAAAIDKILVAGMGYPAGAIPAEALTPDKRAKLVESLRAVSWACVQAAKGA